MSIENQFPPHHKLTLTFDDQALEAEFKSDYNRNIRLPLRYGIIISILSWFSSISLIYIVIPEQFVWLSILTVIYIGSYFGLIIYATFRLSLQPYYHLLGAISNAWAGLYAIYFCDQFPNGESLTLPVLIFIIFFGSYLIQLRWLGAFIAAFSYTLGYHIYIAAYSDLATNQILLYAFVAWMTLIFAVLAGRVAESKNRIAFIQGKTIREQNLIIEREKEVLLREVHHRVKNNLQIIVSMINLQLSKKEQPDTDDGQDLKDIQSRVQSMSLVHQRMQNTSGFSKISLKDYTRELINNIIYIRNTRAPEFDLNIDEATTVDIETAIPLGLIINEMVSNFLKHTTTKESEARFTIQVSIAGNNPDQIVGIMYRDNGPGFPDDVTLENIPTLGLELIDSLTTQINATFKFYNDNGAVYDIKLS